MNKLSKIKTLLSAMVILLIFLNHSFAAIPKNSDGHYFQIDVVNIKSKQELLISKELFEEDVKFENNTLEDSDLSYGLSYKYAFSMKDTLIDPYERIFIAPGFFYEDIELKTKDPDWEDNLVIKSRYGIKLDAGWDFDYGISAYLTNGISAIKYKATWVGLIDSLVHTYDPSYETEKYLVSGTSFAYFYGLGLIYSPIERISFILEYSQQENNIKAAPEGGYAKTGVIFGEVPTMNKITKFGIAYHF